MRKARGYENGFETRGSVCGDQAVKVSTVIWLILGVLMILFGNQVVRGLFLGHVTVDFLAKRYLRDCGKRLDEFIRIQQKPLKGEKTCGDRNSAIYNFKSQISFSKDMNLYRVNTQIIEKSYYFPYIDKVYWLNFEGPQNPLQIKQGKSELFQ
jgi:hypothetical protein